MPMQPQYEPNPANTPGETVFNQAPIQIGEVRLLRVLNLEPTLEIELHHFHLDECPAYEAISYSWGTVDLSKTIICNDLPYQITPHLHAGICSIVNLFQSSWLWVDAICISQTDMEEKAEQVANIQNVFQKALRVLAWLGVEADGSDLAMTEISRLRDLLKEFLDTDPVYNQYRILEMGLPDPKGPVWRALEKLKHRTWFERLWIVQEVVLAQDLVLVCGDRFLAWDVYIALSSQAVDLNKDLRWRFANADERIVLDCLKSITNREGLEVEGMRKLHEPVINNLEFIKLLLDCTSRKTTEPLDRVYAVLGLFDDSLRERIKISYSDESKEKYWLVYRQFTAALLDRLPGFASHIFPPVSGRRPAGLPSWCPNLNEIQHINRLNYAGACAGGSLEKGHWKPPFPSVTVIPGVLQLRVLGCRVDRVLSMVDLSPLASIGGDNDAINAGVPSLLAHQPLAVFEIVRQCWLLTLSAPLANEASMTRALTGNTYNGITVGNQAHAQDFFVFIEELMARFSSNLTSEQTADVHDYARVYAEALKVSSANHAFFSTAQGSVGLGPRTLRQGDLVCMIFGLPVFYILREISGIPYHELIGEAYVDGLMNGEIFAKTDFEERGYQRFLLL